MLSEGPLQSREEIPRRDQVAISTIIFLVAASATMTLAKGCHRFAIRADATASRRSSKRPVRTPLIRISYGSARERVARVLPCIAKCFVCLWLTR